MSVLNPTRKSDLPRIPTQNPDSPTVTTPEKSPLTVLENLGQQLADLPSTYQSASNAPPTALKARTATEPAPTTPANPALGADLKKTLQSQLMRGMSAQKPDVKAKEKSDPNWQTNTNTGDGAGSLRYQGGAEVGRNENNSFTSNNLGEDAGFVRYEGGAETGATAKKEPTKPEKPGNGGHIESEATGTLWAAESFNKWSGVAKKGTDWGFMDDKTGAAGEVHALAHQEYASAGSGIDLKTGTLGAGARAGISADLIGATGRVQAGTANSALGQVSATGEAHVGATAEVGGGVVIDPRKGTATVGAGGEAFAGASITGRVAYNDRYAGVGATGKLQAGIGVSAHVEAGFKKGEVSVKADLGACLGVGGKVSVDLHVNVGAIYADSKDTVVAAAKGALREGQVAAAAVGHAATSAEHAVASGWKAASSWASSLF